MVIAGDLGTFFLNHFWLLSTEDSRWWSTSRIYEEPLSHDQLLTVTVDWTCCTTKQEFGCIKVNRCGLMLVKLIYKYFVVELEDHVKRLIGAALAWSCTH